MADKAFLTETRRDVLKGEYDGSDGSRRGIESKLRTQTKSAINELTAVAASPVIDNREVFDPDEIYLLLRVLTGGHGGVMKGEQRPLAEELGRDEAKIHAWRPDPDYQREVFVMLDRVLREFHADQEENDE